MEQYRFSRESYADAVAHVRPLLVAHWQELATYEDVPLDPNYAVYQTADQQSQLAIYTVRLRETNELVGYAIYFIRGHHHYQSTLWAISDIILVKKEHRNLGVGNGLFDFLERDLQERGVKVVYTMAKLAHPELSMLLEARGHARNEIVHAKRL